MDWTNLREPISAWSHCTGLVLALPATWLLLRRAASDRGRWVSLLVFGLSLGVCYGASTLYHGVRLPAAQTSAFETADYIGIFVLIAGTATPIAWTLLLGRWRRNVLALIWGMAAAGSVVNLVRGRLPLTLATGFYVGMGWAAVLCYFEIARRTSHRALRPILYGGLFYSVGAGINLMEWPSIRPGVFGHHELFHLFVLAGSLCHFWFMLTVVAPYRYKTAS